MSEDKQKDAQPRIDADAFEREVTTDLDEETPDKPKGLALHTRILIGLAVGVIAGVAVNWRFGGDHPRVIWVVDNLTNPVGQLVLRLLLMIVVPLVFSSLVVGVAGIGDIRKLGRVGLKSFGYCLVVSAISVIIGLTLANTIKPGTRIDAATKAALEQRYSSEATKQVEAAKKGGTVPSPLMQVVETLVPSNPFAAMAGVPANPSTSTSGGTPNMLPQLLFRSKSRRLSCADWKPSMKSRQRSSRS
jgi:DAACS family dicarboxylate/amino acid:cation (Na+ or H+) symporter